VPQLHTPASVQSDERTGSQGAHASPLLPQSAKSRVALQVLPTQQPVQPTQLPHLPATQPASLQS
jgi:hypothetical protein